MVQIFHVHIVIYSMLCFSSRRKDSIMSTAELVCAKVGIIYCTYDNKKVIREAFWNQIEIKINKI